jgi:uncharacterized membrane protein
LVCFFAIFFAFFLLWQEAYREWITKEVRTDDITVIVADVSGFFKASGGGGGKGGSGGGGSGKKAAGDGTRRGSLAPTKPK